MIALITIHVLGAFCLLGTVFMYQLIYPSVVPLSRSYCHSHFTGEEVEAQR